MEKVSTNKFGAKQIATVGILLAICIISQFFKNLSIFITGPIINTCIVLAVLMVNLPCAIILSVITPVTAYFITGGAGVMGAVPLIIPFIMLGNIVLAVAVHFLMKNDVTEAGKTVITVKNIISAVICCALKGAFMGLTIALWLLPTFIPAESPLRNKMETFQLTFSLFQFITALIGFIYVFIIYRALQGKGKQ
jgi:hypothetical protein